MSTTIDKIRGLLNLPQLRRFYAEARLDDGRLVVTEAEAMSVGVEVFVLNEEGQAEALADGDYLLEDGTALVITGGRIAQLGEEAPEAETPEVEAKQEEEMQAEDFSSALAALGLNPEQVTSVVELAAQHFTTPPAQDDEAGAVMEAMAAQVAEGFAAITRRLEKLEEAPAAPGVQHTPRKPKTEMSAHQPQPADRVLRAMQTIQNLTA